MAAIATYGQRVAPPRLVSTGEAARALGVAVRTLQRWVREGAVTPDLTTAGGHHRFDVERLREQLDALARRDDLPRRM